MVGYVIVKASGAPRIAGPDGGEERTYCGLDRDPWACVSELYYGGLLPSDLVAIRAQLYEDYVGNYSAGTLASLDDAVRLLSGCAEKRAEFEIIAIEPLADDEPTRTGSVYGVDCYVDGYGSPLALGIFQQPRLFPEFLNLLNPHGLFSTAEVLREYCAAYCERSKPANLEPLEAWQDFCAYAVSPAGYVKR